ncbi:hypothetical protein [Kineococcus sp. SYSU DK005]|uniref:hypothetical protein n=1 Tax=Kineococcus sp. SYSU DK005 TaxID=3383126 RepID=UPI003D7C9869
MSTSSEPTRSDDDKMTLVLVAALFLAFGGAAALWDKVLTKLLELHVILPAGPQITLALPKAAGAGLDGRRLLLAGALVLLLLAAAAGERRRRARVRARGGDGARAGRR